MNVGLRFALMLMAASLLLAACGNEATRLPSPTPTTLPVVATSTASPTSTPTSTLTPVPTIPPTATPIPCDLASAEYCVEQAYFVFQRPVAPPGIDSVDRGYPYGSTEGGTREPHHGVEFHNPSGTPILAAADGSVYYAGDDPTRKFSPWAGFYGNIVVLEHPLSGTPFTTLYTLYAHLSKIDVVDGQTITAGEKIGEVGLSGTAAGSHLHFEVRVEPDDYYATLDPEMWLMPHAGNGTLALLAQDEAGATIFPTFQVQYYPDRTQPAAAQFEVDAYAAETVNPRDPWGEVAALGDQPAGTYRVTFYWGGTFYERWVEIQPGKLTRVLFAVGK
jgi:murein DD-endopeptidase MepM/ murein hydrolase activator NlpD